MSHTFNIGDRVIYRQRHHVFHGTVMSHGIEAGRIVYDVKIGSDLPFGFECWGYAEQFTPLIEHKIAAE